MKKIALISMLLIYSLCTNTYAQEEIINFSIDTARAHQTSLIQTIKRIEQKLESLDELFPKTDKEYDKYKESRKDIITIIENIGNTANNMSSDLTRISKYQNELIQKTKYLTQLENQTQKTKNSIERLTRLLYQLHNEIYDQGVIDDIKIFTKVDNITDAANQEIYMELLLRKLQTLMDELQSDTNNTTKIMQANYEHKNNLQKQVVSYQSNIKDIEKKVAYLESYMELLQENKEAINNHIQDIVNTRTDIENKILNIANNIQQKTFAPIWDWEKNYEKLQNLTNYGAENVYVISWPVLPITYIKWYFNDPGYEQEYGIPHNGIRINIPQGKAVHAARDGVVVEVTESDFGINWITLSHTDDYTTSYLYVNDIFVQEGDVIRKGEVIARSGGELGTRGAGFFSQGSNITFIVTKGGRFINPLTILDLSAIDNEKMIPDDLVFKYKRDKERRPIDLTRLTMMTGETERERQIDFLQTYAKGIYKSLSLREQAGEGHEIDTSFVICIGFAESTLGHYLTTENNIGNVGNFDDPSVRTNIDSGPLAGIKVIYDTLDNQFLGRYNRIDELSRYRREDKEAPIYASSTFNRQNNVLQCLTQIKGYYVPEDYAFRTGLRTATTRSFEGAAISPRQ